MKYEMIFGDAGLFDGAGLFTGIDVVTRNIDDGVYRTSRLSECTPSSLRINPIVAMRRIIKEPKRWTMQDKLAGRLTEVGSKAVSVHGFCVVDILAVRNGCVVACNSDISDARPCVFTIDNFLELYTPIESPEEKAARLRSEWCNRAMDYSTIQQLYDALLSGDLAAPKGGE